MIERTIFYVSRHYFIALQYNFLFYLILYDKHGKKVFNNLVYTVTLKNFSNYYSKFKTFLYKLSHLFTRRKLKIKGNTPLLLPDTIPNINS